MKASWIDARWLLMLGLLAAVAPAGGAEFMFRARVEGRTIEGKPLRWSASQMLLLGRDGALYDFDPKQATQARKTGSRFYGYNTSEMKRSIYEEFGDRFDITTTRHYVVVHPRGERDQWAQRFEDLYRSFGRYFRVRGFDLKEPDYPLAAIVFRNQQEYFHFAESSGKAIEQGTLGHYDPQSNRVFLFDITAGSNTGDWSQNADTIIHEATHQTAYNVGIHSRFAASPIWVVEGLATMFEARGVWDSQSHRSLASRLNPDRLSEFKKYTADRRQEGALLRMVASDSLFRSDRLGAYAEAWALSFYLCETRPREYCDYLALLADRENFQPYAAAARVADFESIFGNQWKMLEVKFLRYFEKLP